MNSLFKKRHKITVNLSALIILETESIVILNDLLWRIVFLDVTILIKQVHIAGRDGGGEFEHFRETLRVKTIRQPQNGTGETHT